MESASESLTLMMEYERSSIEYPLQCVGIEITLERVVARIAAGICTDQNYSKAAIWR
jgi:hypothetical protein